MKTGQGTDSLRPGAHYRGGQSCEFVVWAPRAEQVALKVIAPRERCLTLDPAAHGYWRLQVDGIAPGTDYYYRLDDSRDRPDPASACQPDGVHGPSRVIAHASFDWSDRDWQPPPLEELVIYELHVGTFTVEGTFAAIISRLPDLCALGITAIELMPVAQFPGARNWGYDGASPFAVQNSYGGPDGLKTLVDACHAHGLAVILDVVYNHLGPEGNYLREFGPYFTDRYRTPWGEAINFDGPGSDAIRNYFISNALFWLEHYHVDALRLDAVHAIFDCSARPFLQELADRVRAGAARAGRRWLLIAESDRNDVRLIRPPEAGGCGVHAQWNDDFHHALHVLLTRESDGYYQDFGAIDDLARAYRDGFVFDWRYSSYRQRRHGSSSAERPGRQLVICSQNHDQVGNRPTGDRLITLAGLEAAKSAAAAVLFAPAVPLLFMGEEYGEKAPFLYFVDFSDPKLQQSVRQGRKEEFRAFRWGIEPPDPQASETFERSRLEWSQRSRGRHRLLVDLYRELLRLRQEIPALKVPDKDAIMVDTHPTEALLIVERWQPDSKVLVLLNFSRQPVALSLPQRTHGWRKLFDSAEIRWAGPGSSLPDRVRGDEASMAPVSAALYQMQPDPEALA